MAYSGRRKQRYCVHESLTPLMEGPDLEMHHYHRHHTAKKSGESSWEVIRDWFRIQRSTGHGLPNAGNNYNITPPPAKTQDLRLLLGVLGCPLAPIPLLPNYPLQHFPINHNIPFETSTAHYIIQQYLAATGCSKQQQKCRKNMYSAGMVKMICCQTEISSGKGVKTLGSRTGEEGCFVLWQMSPGMWSLELVVGGNKVIAGSDGKIVWRHTPWLGTHPAKGPQRPLRRLIQGLDPKSTASLFAKSQCLGEKRIGDDDCFVLKVAADRAAVLERNEGPAEVIRHVLYGYFSQRSGLLIYLEDSHLTRVAVGGSQSPEAGDEAAVYWETTIGSSIGDYREVEGQMIAHQGRTVATVFRFGETSAEHCRTTMEEVWRIHDVVFNVPGLSSDSFIPPADIWETIPSP